MALISSVLLLNDTINIETKVDQLFEWIVLLDSGAEYSINDDHREMRFDEFYLAMTSFEKVFVFLTFYDFAPRNFFWKGLSHALGKHSLSSLASSASTNYVRMITGQWMSLADPHHKVSLSIYKAISKHHWLHRDLQMRPLASAGKTFSISVRTDSMWCGGYWRPCREWVEPRGPFASNKTCNRSLSDLLSLAKLMTLCKHSC